MFYFASNPVLSSTCVHNAKHVVQDTNKYSVTFVFYT